MFSNASFLPDNIWTYIQDNAVDEGDCLVALRRDTEKIPEGEWQIPPEQGQFLAFLVGLINAQNILEIGTFTGYGTLCMAQALPDTGKILTLECTSEYSDIGQKHWDKAGVSDRIELRMGMALETLSSLINDGYSETFDFVFIDADKKEYEHYYEFALQLVRPNGLIAVDNMLWRGAVADPTDQKNSTKTIRKLITKIRDDDRVSASLVPIGDGLMLVRRLK